jgi:hypothetical protein
MVVGLPSVVALRSPLEEEPNLGEGSLVWSHPMCSDEVLFMVDDMAKRAKMEVASRSREGVEATLANIGDAIGVVAQLGIEAQH